MGPSDRRTGAIADNGPAPAGGAGARLRVALLMSAESFEGFVEGALGIGRDEYLEDYRNDFSWDYARALRAQGVDLLIYWPSWQHSGAHVTSDGYTVRFLPAGRLYRGVWGRLPVLRRTPPGRYLAEVAHAAGLMPELRRAMAEDRAELLYVQEYWSGRFDLLALRLGRPVAGADHGGTARRQLKLLKRRAFARAAFVTSQSREERGIVARWGAEAVLMPNAVDERFWTPDPEAVDAGAPSVLTVARLDDEQKRISDLIAALVRLPPAWHLDVVGTGDDEAMLRAVAGELGVEQRVRFRGFVADRRVLRDLYRRCAAFALPSSREATTIAVLESMACGAPPVVSTIPAFDELITDGVNGLRVRVGDPDALAQAVQAAFRRRAELGAEARRTVEARYGSENLGRRLGELMRSAAAGSS